MQSVIRRVTMTNELPRWFAVRFLVRSGWWLAVLSVKLIGSVHSDYVDQTVGQHILYGLYGGQRDSPVGNPRIQNIYIPEDDGGPTSADSGDENTSIWEPTEPTDSEWDRIQGTDPAALDPYGGDSVERDFLRVDDDNDGDADIDPVDSEPRSFVSL